ncbi:MAG: RAD55 family ATPase [Thermoplasmatota archaeon]
MFRDTGTGIEMRGKRFETGISELDRMLGGGIPEGKVLLLCSEPDGETEILSLSYLCSGLRSHEVVLYVEFRTIPISSYLSGVRERGILDPLFETDEPIFMNVNGVSDMESLIEIVDRSGIDRIVLSHPEVMALRDDPEWFKSLERLLQYLRTNMMGIILLSSPDGCGSLDYLADGKMGITLTGDGRRSASVSHWPFTSKENLRRDLLEPEGGGWYEGS